MRSGENRDSSIAPPLSSGALPTSARHSRIGLAVAAALAGTGAWSGVQALDAAPAAEASAAGGLAEIVVTARKRTENLQDVPLSVDVLTSKDVQNLGIV